MKKFFKFIIFIVIFSCLLPLFLFNFNKHEEKQVSKNVKIIPSVALLYNEDIKNNLFFEVLDNSIRKYIGEIHFNYYSIKYNNKNAEKTLIDTIDEKNINVIFIIGSEMLEYAIKHAKNYNDKLFLCFNTRKNIKLKNENIVNIYFETYKAYYLLGYIAASITKTGSIAYFKDNNSEHEMDNLCGFLNGVKNYNDKFLNNEKRKVFVFEDFKDYDKEKILEILKENNIDFLNVKQNINDNDLKYFANEGFLITGIFRDLREVLKKNSINSYNNIVSSIILDIDNLTKKLLNDAFLNKIEKGNKSLELGFKEDIFKLLITEKYMKIFENLTKENINDIILKLKNNAISLKSYYDISSYDYYNLLKILKVKFIESLR